MFSLVVSVRFFLLLLYFAHFCSLNRILSRWSYQARACFRLPVFVFNTFSSARFDACSKMFRLWKPRECARCAPTATSTRSTPSRPRTLTWVPWRSCSRRRKQPLPVTSSAVAGGVPSYQTSGLVPRMTESLCLLCFQVFHLHHGSTVPINHGRYHSK